jgi:hypothetical protein
MSGIATGNGPRVIGRAEWGPHVYIDIRKATVGWGYLRFFGCFSRSWIAGFGGFWIAADGIRLSGWIGGFIPECFGLQNGWIVGLGMFGTMGSCGVLVLLGLHGIQWIKGLCGCRVC